MKYLVFILLFFANVFTLNALNKDSVFKVANNYYIINDYQKANELYFQLINDSINNAILFYNAGNTSFKIQKYGYAIWCYEKSLKLIPNNDSCISNLKLVKSKITFDNNINLYNKFLDFFYNINFNYALIFLLFVVLLLSLFISYYILHSKNIYIIKWIKYISLGTLIIILFLCICIFISNTMHYAIVVKSSILYNNEKNMDKILILSEGSKVKILNHNILNINNNCFIETSSGLKGVVNNIDIKEL